MSEQSNQTETETYSDRLAALRMAITGALSDAQFTVAHAYQPGEDAAVTAYTNLWADLLNALIAHADCDHPELLGIVAGTLQMRVPIVGTVSGPDSAVSWNGGTIRFDEDWRHLLGGAGGLL